MSRQGVVMRFLRVRCAYREKYPGLWGRNNLALADVRAMYARDLERIETMQAHRRRKTEWDRLHEIETAAQAVVDAQNHRSSAAVDDAIDNLETALAALS